MINSVGGQIIIRSSALLGGCLVNYQLWSKHQRPRRDARPLLDSINT